MPINGNDTVDYSATGIAGIKQIGTTTYVVLWGWIGTKGEIAFRLKSPPSPVPASPWQWNAAANQAYLAFTYPPVDDSVTEASVIETSGQTLKLLIVDSAQGNRTWIDTNFIACGSSYMDANDYLQFGTSGGRAFVYTAAGRQIVTKGSSTPSPNLPLTTGWSWRSVVEVVPSYNDSLWQQSTSPQTMSSYGCPNGYCWYRTSYTAAASGTATLALPKVHHAAFVFVNGTYCSSSSIPLVAGKNEIAILCAEYNRWKAYNYYSTITDTMRSGILGSVTLNGTALTGWHCAEVGSIAFRKALCLVTSIRPPGTASLKAHGSQRRHPSTTYRSSGAGISPTRSRQMHSRPGPCALPLREAGEGQSG